MKITIKSHITVHANENNLIKLCSNKSRFRSISCTRLDPSNCFTMEVDMVRKQEAQLKQLEVKTTVQPTSRS